MVVNSRSAPALLSEVYPASLVAVPLCVGSTQDGRLGGSAAAAAAELVLLLGWSAECLIIPYGHQVFAVEPIGRPASLW